MDRNAITTTVFLLLVVADVSNASSFWKLRYLADESPTKDNGTGTLPSSPSPTPPSVSSAKKSDTELDSPSDLGPDGLNKPETVTPPPDDLKDPKSLDKPEKVSPPPPQKEVDGRNISSSNPNDDKTKEDNEKEVDSGNKSSSNLNDDKTTEDNEGKKKHIDSGNNANGKETEKEVTTEDKEKEKTNGHETDSKSGITETCDGIANHCVDGHSLTACIKGSGTGSKELVVLVQNSGEKDLKVKIAAASVQFKELEVPKRGTKTFNISLDDVTSNKLVLEAGDGDCVLLVNPVLVSEGNFFMNLPAYNQLVTPVNGAYLLMVTIVIFGGSWACCWMFRKKKRHDGIPYQELEMGMPESMAATEVETAEGWDQGWDDDWDEEKAVKSSSGQHISANGLTARSSNRDGWENDWDD